MNPPGAVASRPMADAPEIPHRSGGTPPRSRRILLLVLALTVAHAAALIAVFRPYLDDQAVNAYSPTRGDAFDYLRRAERLAAGEPLQDVFADRYRMPGYPLFLAAFVAGVERPLAAARHVQVVLASLIIALAYGILRAAGMDSRRALPGALAFALWFPFYYFAPILIPESLSLTLAAALVLVLARTTSRFVPAGAAGAAVLVGLLVYLKPNHLLFLLPVLAFLGARGLPPRRVAAQGAMTLAVTFALLVPWLALHPTGGRALAGLTTAQGKNLYLGAGIATPPTGGTLPDRVAARTALYDPTAPQVLPGEAASELSPVHKERALRAWRERPGAVALYGLAKIGHAFGFSLRGARDAIAAALFLVSLIACGMLLRRRDHLPFAAYYLAALLVVAAQAFVFLPNQRFKVVLFDFPALAVIALALGSLLVLPARLVTAKAPA